MLNRGGQRTAAQDHQEPRALPTEDAALKLLWLALRNAEKKWTYPIKEWQRALHQFAIYFPGRVPVASFDASETMQVHKSVVTSHTEHLTLPMFEREGFRAIAVIPNSTRCP
jgi:hypothetical protein